MARKRPPPRAVEVVRKTQISPNMLRVTLGGSAMHDMPADQNSAYIKLRLPDPGPDSDGKPIVRTYTVRYFDETTGELDVDFVIHDDPGPASEWAVNCEPGDTIAFGGPGPKKLVDYEADWFLLIGDMSALPAIGANIEGMPADARGYALLETIHEDDRQDIAVPPGLEVRWLINPHPDRENSILYDALRSIEWLDGTPSIWVAGEFSQSLSIRKYLKNELGVDRKNLYASSYWQIGQTEDGHRVSKAATAD